VNYDRAGQNLGHSIGRNEIENLAEKNIVKWLLNNPDFVHAGTLTSAGESVFHRALQAHIPDRLFRRALDQLVQATSDKSVGLELD
jgi:hypothetical protein